MRRRQFISLIGGAAAWPLAAPAQQRVNRVWRIGYVGLGPATGTRIMAFRQGLRDLGYVEGQNFVLEHRDYTGQIDRLTDIVAELVNLKVDIIRAEGSEATRAAKQVTSSVPIVMTSTNPLGLGFVASLARPGGNVGSTAWVTSRIAMSSLNIIWLTINRIG